MTPDRTMTVQRSRARSAVHVLGSLLVFLLALPGIAQASLLSPETEDKLATFIALFVLIVVPIVLAAAFWLVHILPEQIAHKRNHPQFEAIRTLCLLSLVFGGLLWPIAWIWAYSKPVLHKLAYGTDKLHEPQEAEESEPAAASIHTLGLRDGRLGLHDRLARLEARGLPASELTALRADIEALEAKVAAHGVR